MTPYVRTLVGVETSGRESAKKVEETFLLANDSSGKISWVGVVLGLSFLLVGALDTGPTLSAVALRGWPTFSGFFFFSFGHVGI